jgi:hypothetical protein
LGVIKKIKGVGPVHVRAIFSVSLDIIQSVTAFRRTRRAGAAHDDGRALQLPVFSNEWAS